MERSDNNWKRLMFAKNFRRLYRKGGYSLTQIAQEVGVPKATVDRWYKGLSLPCVQNLLLIAELFKIHPSTFFNYMDFN